ncbi:phage tail assembly protein T [Cupriavidus oxalaticus]|uniref:Minor tail T domain-containing protein n=1 Tax=Cupriavidus oxalaticus TaxID=96344 RepID=A0A5P3VP05_9BURK|nr:hypothetical protein [Cupriavidus oxalaticus]QEZ47183.1 hypothetical protein D2917_23820 [Cupriavidus oxalaticus]
MAFYQLEPWGSHFDDMRAGVVASTIANIYRDRKKQPDAFSNLDFIPWNEHHRDRRMAEPILLDDPEAQSRLIDQMMFPKAQ